MANFSADYQGLKEIDLILVILKLFKIWGEEKEERKLDLLCKKYVHTANKNTLVNKDMILHLVFVLLVATTKTHDYVLKA